MSLFASAFNTGAGPSSAPLVAPNLGKAHKDGKHNKKKRASLPGGSSGGQHDLRATEANLAKLMKKVEAGEVKGKREGGESMGMGGMSKKDKAKGKATIAAAEEEPLSGKQQQHQGEGKKRKRDSMAAGASSTSTPNKADKKEAAVHQQPQGKKGAKPAPAELPLPHTIPKSELHVDSVKDEKLTEMQRSMQAKLEGARFRWINEQLYSNPSDDAVEMMKKEPKIFEDYHQTHRALTSAWPSPPLPHIITLLTPLPAKSLIVDLGCGDAGLAKALVPQGKIVLSYDLVGDSGVPGSGQLVTPSSAAGGWVCQADFLTHVPLPGRPGGMSHKGGKAPTTVEAVENMSKSQKRRRKAERARDGEQGTSEVVDVVVCCLSLMGTNWVGGIYEACRILKQGGVLHIAEVTSRFVSTEAFSEKICSFGFTLDSETSPSTHFTLFKYTKEADVPLGPARGEAGWDERVKEGERILRGCVYKKR